MSDSTVCDVNGIFILRPMKKRERTKKERAAFLRVSRSETFPSRRCEADVSQFYYEEVFLNTRARERKVVRRTKGGNCETTYWQGKRE